VKMNASCGRAKVRYCVDPKNPIRRFTHIRATLADAPWSRSASRTSVVEQKSRSHGRYLDNSPQLRHGGGMTRARKVRSAWQNRFMMAASI